MKYRIASDLSSTLPFRVFTSVEDGQLPRLNIDLQCILVTFNVLCLVIL